MHLRKYLSEFGLNVINGRTFLTQQDGLEEIENSGVEPHIYIVARRPRIILDEHSLIIGKEHITGIFRKQIKDTWEEIPFNCHHSLGIDKISIKCPYPHTQYSIQNSLGEVIAKGKTALLLGKVSIECSHHLNLEVIYVGQSFGKTGNRIASRRLADHSTLQSIYADTIQNFPDQEIWLILSTFESILLTSIDASSGNYLTSEIENNEHVSQVLSNPISEQQTINFIEAALIRYFKPEYNKIFKYNFPNPAHKTYSECYDIDLNMISVELQTHELVTELWSLAVEPKPIHFCQYLLHSREERRAMFEIF